MISLIIPTLNRGGFHQATSRMLSDQVYQDFEIIVIEERWSYDTHETPIENAEYILIDSPHGKTISIGEKWNRGKNAAKGDLILTLSSDDFFGPNYVSKWRDIFDNQFIDIGGLNFCHYYNIVNKSYGPVDVIQGGHIAFTKEIANKISFPETSFGEDASFIESVIKFGYKFLSTNSLDSDYLTIRHVSSKPKGNKFVSITDPINGGHSCRGDYSTIPDNDRMFLRSRVKNPYIYNFYNSYK